jgi:hypothetical protein
MSVQLLLRRATAGCAAILASVALAGAAAAIYPALRDFYKGPYGLFTHWSAIAEGADKAYPTFAYAVCNLDSKPLFFQWDGPAFGSGWGYPLDTGACATLNKTGKGVTQDDNTTITFTQHNESWNAKAYLPADTDDVPQNWLTEVRGFFLREGTTAPRIVDVSIRVTTDRAKHTRYILTWPQGVAGLAIAFDLANIPEETRKQILAQLEARGLKPRYANAEQMLRPADREHLKGRAAEANYLEMQPNGSAPNGVAFEYDAVNARADSTAPLIALDEEGRAIAIASYTAVH